MKPAIVIPYKNRARYLDVLLDKLPAYLEQVNGIADYRIIVAEQTSSDTFNLALSRNVGAKFVIEQDPSCDYFVFHDVDVIPVRGIDYRPQSYCVAWFMTAGSCKISVDAFVKANGYNSKFVGWGDEDAEFYYRLITLGIPMRLWHKTPESRNAVIANLEMPRLPSTDAERWSQGYWGPVVEGPRFIHFEQADGALLETYDKHKDFVSPASNSRNKTLWTGVRDLPVVDRLKYFQAHGMELIDLSPIQVLHEFGNVTRIRYRNEEVLREALAN